jgi:transcription initiation factor TFIIIB Brf1 subunit/transcription initiation factor TFIIB
MSNRSYPFEITWCWKEEGNRPENIAEVTEVKSTTVGRAISKLVRELNTGDNGEQLPKDHQDYVRSSDLLVIDVRNHRITSAIIAKKREDAGTAD